MQGDGQVRDDNAADDMSRGRRLATAIGLPALIIGTWLGWKLYGKLDEASFRRVVLALLLISGLALVASGR